MLPNKLQHGDNLASLFDKFNRIIDYLREIRLVAGHGIRINRLPAGTTIESTATATGGTQNGSAPGHPFDVEIINKGTEETPVYYARVYNSALPDSPDAGLVYGTYDIMIPVTELQITASGFFNVWLVVKYDPDAFRYFDASLRLYPQDIRPPEDTSETAWCRVIATIHPPLQVSTYYTSNIEITGRWF